MTPPDYSESDSEPGITDSRGRPARASREGVFPLSVLHLHQKTSLSTGSVQQMMQAAGGLSANGHHVIVVTPPSPDLRKLGQTLGVEVEFAPFRHLLDLRTIFRLRHLIRRHRPDVLHAHKGLAHWMALAALAGNPLPVLVANRGVSFPLTPLNRGKYRSPRTDRIITVCEAIKEIIRTSGKIDPAKIDVVYAATDMGRFDRDRVDGTTLRRAEGIPDDAFVILQSGTRDWKGWKEVVDGFEALLPTVPNSRLLIVGDDGAERETAVRAYLSRKGLSDLTLVLGYRADIPEILATADVTVDASWDGTGITGTVRESMAIGTAVIATDCGGNRELIHDSRIGWLIEPRNHSRLVAALQEVAAAPEKRASVAAAAASFVRPNFSIERRIERLESIYLEAVRDRRARYGVPHASEESAGYSG